MKPKKKKSKSPWRLTKTLGGQYMKQSVQLKKNLEDLKARIRSLQAENRIDEAH